MKVEPILRAAWESRQARGLWRVGGALRIFYGPGEGEGPLRSLSIDRFGDGAWITEWGPIDSIWLQIRNFLEQIGIRYAVRVTRVKSGASPLPTIAWGENQSEVLDGIVATEGWGGKFKIRFAETRHPGLFLDHIYLREWLMRSARDWRVLNLFAYTGSLSVAAGRGGAREVVTVDLSKPTLAWAEENWQLNQLSASAKFIVDDVLKFLPRQAKKGEIYDCILSDPPSFSRSERGVFSTSKDLVLLHASMMKLVAPNGYLVTSINSENIERTTFENQVKQAAEQVGLHFKILHTIDLPETFPTRLGVPIERYLKGWILQRQC